MNAMRPGCQTFTWEMLGSAWTGRPDDLLASIARAGYRGIEISDKMIGTYKGRPEPFGRALCTHGLELVAYACASETGFTEPDALADDLRMAGAAIDFAEAFPGAHVSFGSATIVSEGPRDDKFDAAAHFYNEAALLGVKRGVPIAVHPSSHHHTLLFTRKDYDDLFSRVDPGSVGWVPDTGHMLRGRQDLLKTLDSHRDRIRYLHLKDVDRAGEWQMLGAGVCDLEAILGVVTSAPHFNGWVVAEEESWEASQDPTAAIAKNRQTLSSLGI